MNFAKIDERGQKCLIKQCEVSEEIYSVAEYSLKVFEEPDLFMDDESIPDMIQVNIHSVPAPNAQKSLLIIETYFLLQAIPKDAKATLLYIGADPGDHLNILAEMFPNITFHVYDPLEMKKITETHNLIKHQQTFTDDFCYLYEENPDTPLLLISDIRNKNYSADPKTKQQVQANADMILNDMDCQQRWVKKLKPRMSLLRFRPLLKTELEERPRARFEYLTGVHLKLPYSKEKTNSMMLMVGEHLTTGTYYDNDIVDHLKYHNIVIRNTRKYINPFTYVFNDLLSIEEISQWVGVMERGKEHYVMNTSWDARITFFVFSLWLKEKLSTKVGKHVINDFILTAFTRLENVGQSA